MGSLVLRAFGWHGAKMYPFSPGSPPVGMLMALTSPDSASLCILHRFCDASPLAYGTAAYLITECTDGSNESNLVMAKMRVAPVRPLSLPRLELMSALLASWLLKLVSATLPFWDLQAFLWTDSLIMLRWVQGSPTYWKPFVQNQVWDIVQVWTVLLISSPEGYPVIASSKAPVGGTAHHSHATKRTGH